ncbi:DUF1593 domain-containing protein [Sphingosinicella terrae]|uniref:DUF1593 domain-containing protein n=1 Tax=Sphingosinicella terrae TaxID=2172047 RepID=UPI0025496F76|nr:nucleoside hydrolase-like domain-containing protein [Sphingosinicella terrae]
MSKSRLFVLTDIDADPDDTQSLIRLLLYSNEIDIEGLVATTSVWKRTSVAPESIRAIIETYGEVLPNLRLHDPDYPAEEALAALVSQGQPRYGMTGVGDDMDSPGSVALVAAILDDDDRPLWVNAWGGINTLAQALYRLRETRSPEEVARLTRKLWVYAISDQDDAGPWIRREFPEVNYIVTPGGDYGSATWGGINHVIEGIDNATISNRWLAENIQQDHGALGAAYPDVAWSVEGDTPAFLALIPNGLSVPENPAWGGWGGRYRLYAPAPMSDNSNNAVAGVIFDPETRPIWTNAEDAYGPPLRPEYGRSLRPGEVVETSARATLWRWRDAFQNDFAARMDWTIRPYGEANHPPVVRLQGANAITVRSGQAFGLSARGTSDPDGDSLTYYWFHYPEPGSWHGDLSIGAENADGVWITAPEVRQRETLHVILAVTDKGSPPLTRYERVVVTVEP